YAGEVSVRGLYGYVEDKRRFRRQKGCLRQPFCISGNNKRNAARAAMEVRMYSDRIVLCGASAYEQKYYFNRDFSALPKEVQDELHIMCVLFTEDVGGILTLEFSEEGKLEFKVEALDAD